MQNQISRDKVKPGVLFFCGTGYAFDEIFYPVIKELKDAARIFLLLSGSYLNKSAERKWGELKENSAIEICRIIHVDKGQKESLRHYHHQLSALSSSLQGLDVDLVVLGTDYPVFSRYILRPFSDPKIKKVVLQSGTIRDVIQAYRKHKQWDLPKIKPERLLDPLLPLRWLKRGTREFFSWFRQWQNHYLFPYWCQKATFPLTGYEHLHFATGLCDYAICFDPLEQEAVRTTNPLLKQVYLARHPVDRILNGKEKTGRLLVTFSGNLGREMPEGKMKRWLETIQEVVKLKGMAEIHLRFHPRLTTRVQWPGKIISAVKELGCSVKVIDTREKSLTEILPLYDGMVGGPSGALRVARAIAPSLFIIGLPNCSDCDENDQTWMLGAGEGIHWIKKNEGIRFEHLRPPVISDDQRPLVSDILLNLMEVHS